MSFKLAPDRQRRKVSPSSTTEEPASVRTETTRSKSKLAPSKCIVCKADAPIQNGRYFDDACRAVYEHRVCSQCGYAFTVRRPMTDSELKTCG